VLINNAATVQPLGSSPSMDPGSWAASIDINVVAPASLAFRLLPEMLDAGWGRIANVSSGVAANPRFMIGGNAYATTKAALEARTLNLAAEVADTGVTVNVFRPGTVDTAMQAWIRDRGAGQVSTDLHKHFTRLHTEGRLITPEQSARSLVARLDSESTGQIWDISDVL
jgi:NAD(P)-dependent dehydrogenase (short-subunit alcohol dehydrogenase family)